jgi:hypothetical protein
MHIELVGAPGTGKTSVAAHLSARLGVPAARTQGFDPEQTQAALRADRVRSVLANPMLLAAGIRMAAALRDRRAIGMALNLARRNRLVAALPAATVLDEGILHGLFAALCRMDPPDAVRWARLILRRLPCAKRVIWLRVDPQTAQRRSAQKNPAHALTRVADMDRWVERYDELVRQLVPGAIQIWTDALTAEQVAAEASDYLMTER